MSAGTEAIVTGKPRTYTGGMAAANLGTILPKPGPDAFRPLGGAFDFFGYLGPDGFTKNSEASDNDEYAWGGIAVNTTREEFGVTYTGELRETGNPVTLRRVFGEANVIEDTANGLITVKTNANMAPRQSFVFDMLDRELGHREVIPNGQILASGEQTFAHGASTVIPFTLKAYPNKDGDNAWNMKEVAPTGTATEADALSKTATEPAG